MPEHTTTARVLGIKLVSYQERINLVGVQIFFISKLHHIRYIRVSILQNVVICIVKHLKANNNFQATCIVNAGRPAQ